MTASSNVSKNAGVAAENSSLHSSMLGSKVGGPTAQQVPPSVKSEGGANLGQLSIKSGDISGGPHSSSGVANRTQNGEKIANMVPSALASKPYGQPLHSSSQNMGGAN
jgi:hypothetical protein